MRFLIIGVLLLPGFLTAQISRPGERFAELDQNGDGKLSPEELPRPQLFPRVDQNQDGFLSREEVIEFFRGRVPAKGEGERKEVAPLVVTEAVPGDAPVSAESCSEAAAYSAQRNGFSLLVQWKGETIFERYDNGWTPDRANRLASGTKSFSGVMAAAAIEDELISSFEEKVSDTIHEWKGDDLRKSITLRQLLSLHGGIERGENGRVPSYADSISARGEVKPGSRFAYGPNAFQIFGEVMRRKLEPRDMDPLAYLTERIFEPIGLEPSHWRRDENGMPHLPSGAFLTAREWAKFGRLLIQEGAWGDQQIVAADLLAECVKSSPTNPAYGITFWLLSWPGDNAGAPGAPEVRRSSSLPSGTYAAAGAGKQKLYLIPSLDLVVVRQGESKANYQDQELFRKLLLPAKS